MRTFLLLCLSLSLLAAQQPNSAPAAMRINGQDGPPWPITGVNLTSGRPLQLDLTGAAGAPFALAASSALAPTGLPILGGELLDLDPTGLLVIWDPIQTPAFALDASGLFLATATTPVLPAGSSSSYQAAVFDPAAPQGVRLTAATQTTAVIGIVTITHAPGANGVEVVDLTPYGLALPFYGSTWSSCFVSANGQLSFGAPALDFTPSPAEMARQMPRICPFWTNLDPSLSPGGSITTTIDLTGASPQVRLDYVGIRSSGTPAVSHSMSCSLDATTGGITIVQAPNQPAANYVLMVGIGAGFLGQNAQAQTDLGLVQDTGGAAFPAGAPIFEWFGSQGQNYYTGPTNTYDLAGRTLNFFPISTAGGVPGAQGYLLF